MSHVQVVVPPGAAILRRTSTPLPTARIAMWWFLASEIAIFGGAVACYLLYRFAHPEWADEAHHTLAAAGAFNTIVLLTSSLCAVLADQAAGRRDGADAARFLSYAFVGGVVFLGVKAFEYGHEIAAGFVPARSLFWSFYFLMTGLHGLHVFAGMLAMALVAVDASQGRNLGRVEIAAIYWHFVDVVWIFLFPLLYLAR